MQTIWHDNYPQTGPPVERLLSQNDYTYNNNSQRTSNTVTTTNAQSQPVSRTESYTYDEQSRLKTAGYGDGQNQTYSFDAMGNRTAKTDNVTGGETYAFDDANRIATRQVGAGTVTTYTSDANGNMLADASHTNQWDSQNRLVSSLSNGKTSDFRYGADGLRRKMAVTDGDQAPITITHYGYDGSNVVREWEENIAGVLNVSATYLLGPNGPMYKRPANAADVRWYVYDGLGSVVGEVDVSGNLLAEKKHDVFGLRRGTVGTEKSRHGFVGGLGHYSDDETGLVYMRARYYDPAIGRFVSEDPKHDGMNWFSYAGNNPVNMVDADGKSSNWVGEALKDLWRMMDTTGAFDGKGGGGLVFIAALIFAICYVLDKNGHELTAATLGVISTSVGLYSAGSGLYAAIVALCLTPAGPVMGVVLATVFLACAVVAVIAAMDNAQDKFSDPSSRW